MANYDTKLGEWFKQVEQRAQELLAKKRSEQSKSRAEEATRDPQEVVPKSAAPPSCTPQTEGKLLGVTEPTEAPARQEPTLQPRQESFEVRNESSVITAAEKRDVAVVEPETKLETSVRNETSPALFDDADVPPVEDFLSFLSRSGRDEKEPQDSNTKITTPEARENESLLTLTEGTGTPRPITPEPDQKEQPQPVAAAPETKTKQKPAPAATEKPAATSETVEQKWERVPQHLRILFEGEVEEVAQHSYKTFKESRASLIQRLLDPTITLEDAARILNVCPTTVRRYTNKGILKHFRTAGNQRRFKLSDVLAFLESRTTPNKE